ncbi:MAG: S1C family serine protease [Planctomycetota bacterium]
MNSFWNCRRLVAFCGLVGFSAFSFAAVASGADLGNREDRPDTVVQPRAEEPTLAALLNVQNSIRNVVDRNLPAVISISDGAGFGSGVIVSSEGLILTAGHVVNTGASQFEIFFPGGQTASARLLGYNLNVDAAMLKLEGSGPWPFVELGEQASLKKGDWVVCLGHSGGYELGRKPPVRTGRVLDFRDEMVVTDAVLIGGDSGGPLFDTDGKLIGIHSSIGEVIAENRHVSIDLYRRDWDRLARGERWGQLPDLPGDIDKHLPPEGQQPDARKTERAKLGVKVDPTAQNAIVSEVTPGSPAERIGLKRGDVIEIFGGIKVESGNQLIDLVRQRRVGESVRLQVRRGQSLFQLEVILDQF